MTEVEIRPGFLFLCSAALLFCGLDTAVCALAAIVIHELAHILVACFFGGRLDKVVFGYFGISMQAAFPGFTSYFCDGVCAASGPVANLIVGVVAACAAKSDIMFTFAGTNILLGLYNAIPTFGLDGGVIIGSALKRMFSLRTAETVQTVIACAVSAWVCGLGVWLCAVSGNVTLLICGAGLGLNVWKNSRRMFSTC